MTKRDLCTPQEKGGVAGQGPADGSNRSGIRHSSGGEPSGRLKVGDPPRSRFSEQVELQLLEERDQDARARISKLFESGEF